MFCVLVTVGHPCVACNSFAGARFNIIAEMLFISRVLVFSFISIFKSNCAAWRQTQYHNVHLRATSLLLQGMIHQ